MRSQLNKLAIPLCLLSIFLFAVAINYIATPSFLAERSSDEHAYIGLANKLVYFQNKDPQFFPWQGQGSHLFSYSLGFISLISGISTESAFRIVHLIVIFFIILSGYLLGKELFLQTGPLLAFSALFALIPSTGTWVGPAAMVPSTLAFIPIINIIRNTISRTWKWPLAVWLLLLALIYAWFLVPVAAFLLVYWLFLRTRFLYFMLSLVGLVVGWLFVAKPLLSLFSSSFVWLPMLFHPISTIWENVRYPGRMNYIQFLLSHTNYLLPIAIVALSYVIWRIIKLKKQGQDINSSLSLGFLLLVASALFLLIGGDRLLSRSIIFLFIGLFVLVIYFFSFILKKQSRLSQCLLVLIFIVGAVQVAQTNASQLFEQLAMTNAERSMIEQLRQMKKPRDYLILSDINSMLVLDYYLDIQNIRLLDAANKDYVGMDREVLMNFFVSPTLLSEELEFLDGLKNKTGAKEILILSSNRTRVSVSSFRATGRPKGARGVPKNFAIYAPTMGEQKLFFYPFQLISQIKNEEDSSFANLYKYK